VGRTSAARGAPAQRPARSTAATVDEPAEEHEFVVVAGDETDLNDEIISANVEELGRMAFGIRGTAAEEDARTPLSSRSDDAEPDHVIMSQSRVRPPSLESNERQLQRHMISLASEMAMDPDLQRRVMQSRHMMSIRSLLAENDALLGIAGPTHHALPAPEHGEHPLPARADDPHDPFGAFLGTVFKAVKEGLDKVRQVGQAVAQRVGAIIQGAVQNLMTMAEEMTNDHAHPGVDPADARLRKVCSAATMIAVGAIVVSALPVLKGAILARNIRFAAIGTIAGAGLARSLASGRPSDDPPPQGPSRPALAPPPAATSVTLAEVDDAEIAHLVSVTGNNVLRFRGSRGAAGGAHAPVDAALHSEMGHSVMGIDSSSTDGVTPRTAADTDPSTAARPEGGTEDHASAHAPDEAAEGDMDEPHAFSGSSSRASLVEI